MAVEAFAWPKIDPTCRVCKIDHGCIPGDDRGNGSGGGAMRGADGRYPPIESHAIIGDLQTVALVGLDGCIDFLCLPHFDSPSVFAGLLDADKGGSFKIVPRPRSAAQQAALPPRHQHAADPVPRHRGRGGDLRLHADPSPRAHQPAGPPGEDGPGRDPLPGPVRPALRLRPGRAHAGAEPGGARFTGADGTGAPAVVHGAAPLGAGRCPGRLHPARRGDRHLHPGAGDAATRPIPPTSMPTSPARSRRR